MSDDEAVAAHVQKITHNYTVRYPAHEARTGDPNYVDFNHIKRLWMKDPVKWRCSVGVKMDDFSECSLDKPLEIHHSHIEFALLNEIDLDRLNHIYPGVGDPNTVGAWVESADNLEVLCEYHHRGHAGAHVASASDYEGILFVKDMIQ